MKRFMLVVGMCVGLCASESFAYIVGQKLKDWTDPGVSGKILVNGNYYGEDVVWTVTLKAGTAGSLFGDTMGPVETFRYETAVTVDGIVKYVIPGGTWSSDMGDSTYTVRIPLKALGIFSKDACGTYYLTAYTRNYSGGSTVSTGYSLITEDIYVQISYEEECTPEKYSLKIESKDDKTHPDGVMLEVTGTLPKGTSATIYRDGDVIASINKQGLLFDRVYESSWNCVPAAPKTYSYMIIAETACNSLSANCNGTPGLTRVGRMSITNENYKALVVKYPQPENLTVEFTDAENLINYNPASVYSIISGETKSPRPGKLDPQVLDAPMESAKIRYTIKNEEFNEGTHGDYTFDDQQSYYFDKDITLPRLKHVIPFGPAYEPAESRVLFMRDDYYGHPGMCIVANGKEVAENNLEINWFRYWQKERDGTIDLLTKTKNIRLGCKGFSETSKGHAGFHYGDDNKHWVCLVPDLSATRTPEFKLHGTSIVVGAGLPHDENDACPSNSCHQVAATVTHELQHRMVRKRWFEDVGLRFAIDGSGEIEYLNRRYRTIPEFVNAIRDVHMKYDSDYWFSDIKISPQEVNVIGRIWESLYPIDYFKWNGLGDHLSDATEDDPFRIEWVCPMSAAVEGVTAQAAISQLRFDKGKPDTYDIAQTHIREGWKNANWSSYATYGDDEVCARLAERYYDTSLVHNARDWSVKNPDKLKIGTGAAITTRSLAVRLASSEPRKSTERDGSYSFTCTQCPDFKLPSEMNLLGITSADGVGVTANGSPYYSALRFDVTLSSLTNGLSSLSNSEFIVRGYLADDAGRVIAGAVADAAFTDADDASATLDFDGKILYNARGAGYQLAAVTVEIGGLIDVDMLPVASVTNVAGCVRTFNYSDFARPDVVLDRTSFTESADGTNLLVGIAAEVNVSGIYTLEGVLAASNHSVVASFKKEIQLSEGTNVMTQTFSGERIAEMGFDGPYTLELVKLTGADGYIADILVDSYVTTNAYSAEFLRPVGDGATVIYVAGTSGWLEPQRKNGTVHALRYGFEIDNPVSSNMLYSVQSVLETEDGTVVGTYRTATIFSFGVNSVVLDYPAADFRNINTGSRYRVKSVTLVPMHDDTRIIRLASSELSREFLPEDFAAAVGFDFTSATVDEGGHALISVSGGSEEAATSVKVYLTYGTATAADLSLGKVKYPITLKWAKGEVTNKTFTVKVKTDSIAEGFETFALQLANHVGMVLGDAHVCTVSIKDKTSSLTLAEGLNNGLISPSCAKSSKWTAVESYKSDTNETKRTYVQSPAVAAGKSSTITAGTFKGKGYIHFSLKFTGNDNGKKKAAVKVYDGKNLLGTINTTQNGSDWHSWYALCSGTGTHVIKFVFVQGAVKSVRMRLTDIWWEPYDGRPAWQIYATTSKLNGGYVGGQGIYADGTKITLKPRLRAGYEFDYWYDYYNDTVLDSPATLSLTVATNGYYVAYVKYTPVVRGLPETASGGTVSGGGMCASGKRVTLTAKPAKNHTFEGWYVSKDGNENEIDEEAFVSKAISLAVDRTAKPVAPTAKLFVVTGLTESVTYFAKFKPYPKVTVAVEGAKGGTVKGAGSYLAGKTVTLKATPKKGYAFTGWYDGSNLVTLAATYKYKMTAGGAALTAGFKKESALARPEFVWEGATNLTMGVCYAAKLSVVGESAVSITKVAGLPKGLAYKGGKVSGVPAKAGSFTATVTVALVSNKKKTWVYKVKLAVAALPAFAQGTFNGWSYAVDESGEDGHAGRVTLPVRKVTVSVTGAGKITAKVGTLSLARTGWTVGEDGLYTATLSKTRTVGTGKKAKKYKDVLTLTLDPDKVWTEDQLSGSFSTFLTTAPDTPVNADTVVSARRNPFGDKENLEAKAVAAELAARGVADFIDGDGVAWKLKVSTAGVATISRTTGSGKKKQTVSATAVVEVDSDGVASARFLVGGKVVEAKL